MQATSSAVKFFATPPHPCSYLPARDATTIFADPRLPLSMPIYGVLAKHGFRRSGHHVYRPHCGACRECVPVRIVVDAFEPRRIDHRTLKANVDLVMIDRPPEFDPVQFALYERYLANRHAGGGMDDPTPGNYMGFLTAPWSATRFLEFRSADGVLAVAVVDHFDDALSAVYTYFEPAAAARSLGRYAILQEIELARSLGLKWLYLGYWIAGCAKMSYKDQFQPLEYFRDGHWRRTPD